TTTIRLLTGFYSPTSGEATVLGHRPSEFTRETRARMGYMPQHFVLYPNLTVSQNLNFAASIYGVDPRRGQRVKELLEFVELAESAAATPAGFFLHRDFQSRNLMLHNGCLRVIDFQGGRFGPLGYDLASLLIDPYAALPAYVQERLVQKYMETLSGYSGVGGAFSIENYYLLALQRNLQILGAFAFLSEVRRKVFFRGYLAPATLNLHRLLQEPGGRCFPVLRAFADELPGMVEQRLLRFRLS
ncbi:MAG: phosphotransferase, partial [Desulfurivibrionaceae bacterium]|nr:phosphotransferase [Desulfurivibrionaceae bacterium]